MDVAARGVLSRESRAALDAHLDDRMLNGATTRSSYFELIERTRGRFAAAHQRRRRRDRLHQEHLRRLNMIATADPLAARATTSILCPRARASEQRLRVAQPAALRASKCASVPPRDGHMPVDEIIARMDGAHARGDGVDRHVRPGFPHRRRDARQSVPRARRAAAGRCGAVGRRAAHRRRSARTSTRSRSRRRRGCSGSTAWASSIAAANGRSGCSPRISRASASIWATRHEASMGSYDYKLAAGARRFDLGNYNFLATAAVDASTERAPRVGTAQYRAPT